MKKKLLTIGLLIALAATAVIGGTLAYFTDKDGAVNEFAVGKVDIELIEHFTPSDATLVPGTKINKDVEIRLEAESEDTYVWYEYLVPTALDDVATDSNAANIVHIVNTDNANWDYNHPGMIGTEEIDGIQYNKYVALYSVPLTENTSTGFGMDYVYLDEKVDYDPDKLHPLTNEKGQHYVKEADGTKTYIEYDFTKNVNIIVRSYGIQAAGFDTALEAYEAYQAQ